MEKGITWWYGVGKLIEVEGKMDVEQYCEILDDGLVESFETLEMEEGEWYFQQDNDPKYTSKKAKSGLKTMIFKSYPGQPNPLT